MIVNIVKHIVSVDSTNQFIYSNSGPLLGEVQMAKYVILLLVIVGIVAFNYSMISQMQLIYEKSFWNSCFIILGFPILAIPFLYIMNRSVELLDLDLRRYNKQYIDEKVIILVFRLVPLSFVFQPIAINIKEFNLYADAIFVVIGVIGFCIALFVLIKTVLFIRADFSTN